MASVGRQSRVGWRGRRESALCLCQSRRVSGDLSQARGESRGQVRRAGPGGSGSHVSSQLSAESETVVIIAISRTEALCHNTSPRSDNIGQPGNNKCDHGTHATCKNMKNGRSK